MMKDLVSNKSFFSNVGKPRRKPLRTFAEMCEEFGVTEGHMKGLFSHNPDHPKEVLRSQNSQYRRNRWYDPDEFRTWFKRVKAAKVPA